MSRILLIDSSGPSPAAGISENGIIKRYVRSETNRSFSLHEAVSKLVAEEDFSLKELQAVAVTAGPGSYTGLRVGMAAAKGLCYALDKKLLLVNTMEAMARAMEPLPSKPEALLCPMIDARRDEVFMALYDHDFNIILAPQPMTLPSNILLEWMDKQDMLFAGSGAKKWASISRNSILVAKDEPEILLGLAKLADQYFSKGQFADIMYSEPAYLKEFYTSNQPNL